MSQSPQRKTSRWKKGARFHTICRLPIQRKPKPICPGLNYSNAGWLFFEFLLDKFR
jgi:hypothetical protein